MLPIRALGSDRIALRPLSASGATVTSKAGGPLHEEALIFVAVGCIADGACCWRRRCHRKADCTFESRHRDFSACRAASIEAAGTPARRRDENGAVSLVSWIACVARFALFVALTNRQGHEEALVSIGGVAGGACHRRGCEQCEACHADKHIPNDRSVTRHTNSGKAAGAEACEELILRAVCRPLLA
jgi:hypothetical protein